MLVLVFVAEGVLPTSGIATAAVRDAAKQSRISSGRVLKGTPPLFGLESMDFKNWLAGTFFSLWCEVTVSHVLYSRVHPAYIVRSEFRTRFECYERALGAKQSPLLLPHALSLVLAHRLTVSQAHTCLVTSQ